MKYNLPTVSVIVPVCNAESNLPQLINSLVNQDYPKELIEFIFIDNNSTDNSRDIISKYPVKLFEVKDIQSSYAARNKGVKCARHDILAFTDADCIAMPQWIKEGVSILVSESADLAGGKVEFYFSKDRTAAEFFDSIINMQNAVNIKERNVAKTANLFSQAHVFQKIGMFLDSTKSGGDVEWTARATAKGFRLVYASGAVVKHPARRLKTLVKKQYLVGKGQSNIWIKKKKDLKSNIYRAMPKSIFPYSISTIRNLINERGSQEMHHKILKIWLVSLLCYFSARIGNLISLFSIRRR